MAIRGLPLSILVSWYALRSVADDVLEAAALDGAGPLGRLLRIAVPQRLSALLAAWLAAFAVSLGDLAATVLVTPPGVTTVAIRIFGLLHAGVDDQVAGLCLTTIALFALLAAATMVTWRSLMQPRNDRSDAAG
jgi:ABC-type spermidine/putrescine transport system permease subunit II